MTVQTLKPRDKLFWFCAGFGGVVAIYFCIRIITPHEANLANFRTITHDNECSLQVPYYLHETDSIYERAMLQFTDTAKSVFLVLVSEKKADLEKIGVKPTLFEYADYVRVAIEDAFTSSKPVAIKSGIVNTMETITYELEGDFGDEKIFYIVSVYSSPKIFYQLISWAKTDMKPQIRKDIYTTLQSLSLLEE